MRYKNVAVLLREKSTTLVSNESIWIKENSSEELPEEEEQGLDLKGKKKVHFAEFLETKTEKSVERSKMVEKDKAKMPDVRILKTVFRMDGMQWTLFSVYGPQRRDVSRSAFGRSS